jgi:hypothetical protein
MMEKISQSADPSAFTAPGNPLAKMIITRAEGFSQLMSLAKVPIPERYTPFQRPEMLHLALMDGKRTCYDGFIISNFFLQRSPAPGETEKLAETFRFLAQYGYWSITEK